MQESHLANVLSNQTAHHHALRVDEQVGLGLGGSAQGGLLETQLVVGDAAHVLGLVGVRAARGG